MQTLTDGALMTVTLVSRVVMVLDERDCLLANGRRARRALGCLIEAKAGDLVLVAQVSGEGECHVLQVLERSASMQAAEISIPGQGGISFKSRSIEMNALEAIGIRCVRDVSVTSVSGGITLTARNLFSCISENIIQQSQHFVGKAAQFLLDVRHLLKLHSQDALITAERDIKADAERISMG